MGAGCSTSPSSVYDHTRVKPPSHSSSRLLNAFGDFSKVPSRGSNQPFRDDSQSDLDRSSPSDSTIDLRTTSATDLLLSSSPPPPQHEPPRLSIITPTYVESSSPPKNTQTYTDDNCTHIPTSPSQPNLKLQHSLSIKQQPTEDGEMPRSNSDETPSKPALAPLPDNSRRRNSISVLPSFQPKPKLPGTVNSSSEAKKTDPDLVLWISNKLKTKLKLARISKAYDRFIPSNFYSEMGKQDIREVDLGECVIVRKSILFCDIRNFTAFSSKIGPQDTFKFINAFSRRLLPVIRKHSGYIDKFIGDALVALFPTPAHSLFAGQEILLVLETYNHERSAKSLSAVRVGIGCHTGTLMLGTVGDSQRMDGIAIGNVISLASQVEMATKLFGVDFIATQAIMSELKEEDQSSFLFRRLGRIKEGTDDDQLTNIYQVCTAQSPVSGLKDKFEEGVDLFQQKDFANSADVFRHCLTMNPQDKPSLVLENRAQHFLACTYLPADWCNGLTYHTEFMTQSAFPSLSTSPSSQGFHAMGGNPNIMLMRLVFSAIFHMQKKVSEADDKSESDEEENDKEKEKDKEKGRQDVELPLHVPPNGRVSLPPISSSKSMTKLGSIKEENVEKELAKEVEKEKKLNVSEDKDRDLITLVLSGFENHNRVSYLTKAYQRFVPNDFLTYLGKDNVQHVDIGDSMMTTITTMFIEIHGFQPKSRMISEKTFNQIQELKRFGESSPTTCTHSTTTNSTHLQPPQEQSASSSSSSSPSPAGRRLGRMASQNTASMRADLFSFQFLNTISQKLLPIIRQCDGYVDKFFGNAILALFPSLDAATSAGLQIMTAVKSFELSEEHEDSTPPYAQIGMNSGNVILGTVGDGKRMDGTVIGNTVNVAARMLALNKVYNTKFITTSKCIAQLGQSNPTSPQPSHNPPTPTPTTSTTTTTTTTTTSTTTNNNTNNNTSSNTNTAELPPIGPKKDSLPPPKTPGAYKFYNQRVLDTVRVPGKDEAIIIHEIFDNESQVAQIKAHYEAGLMDYQARNFEDAKKHCEEALLVYPGDVPSQMLLEKCNQCIRDGVNSDWDGVSVVSVK